MHHLANLGSAGLSSGRFDGLDRPLDLLDQIVQESTLVQKTLVSGRIRHPDFVNMSVGSEDSDTQIPPTCR